MIKKRKVPGGVGIGCSCLSSSRLVLEMQLYDDVCVVKIILLLTQADIVQEKIALSPRSESLFEV